MAGICRFMRMLIIRKLPQTSEMHVQISEFADSWGCKSAGNFGKYPKCFCKIQNLLTHGNVNQPEISTSIGNACVNSGICQFKGM